MRDWLSHLVLSELYERRQRGSISIDACQVVRESVKTGNLSEGVAYLIEDAPDQEGAGSEWFESELRTALAGWEADGEIAESTASAVREHLDAEEWAAAAEALTTA